MMFHSLKLGFFILYYLHNRLGIRYTDFLCYLSNQEFPESNALMLQIEIQKMHFTIEKMLKGKGRGNIDSDFGAIYWDEEEIHFLQISNNLPQFYRELDTLVTGFLHQREIEYSLEELKEVIEYQRLRIPLSQGTHDSEHPFQYNFPDYFATSFTSNPIQLEKQAQTLILKNQKDYQGDKKCYAKETILWGRKSGTMLVDI